ncbi:hypothetical protein ACGFJ7_31210 [Actinoplanes sp. NPDC048988]|uniref:hypothetical protein n=1 Tax=Actinoplanes sp. NPDC048988 TaxID=3363901 RepID=UPI003716C6D0
MPDRRQGPARRVGQGVVRGGGGDLEGDGEGDRLLVVEQQRRQFGCRRAAGSRRRDPDEVGGLWGRLADGAVIVEKYGPSPFSPGFGMLTDRFGVTWILQVRNGR